MGSNIMDIWGGKVKYVRRGLRNNRQAAYLNLKRAEGQEENLSRSVGLALDDMSLPQGWTGECARQSHYIFSRKERKEYNAQRLTLELSVELPPSSDPIYLIRSHGCVTDIGSVLQINSRTAISIPQQISSILQFLDSVPICLGLFACV